MELVTIKPGKEPGYEMKESLRTFRTNIAFCGTDIRVIMFTSCMPDEGKSTVVFNLARALTDSGKKVLIVDDNKLNCKVVTKLLESYKLEVNVISSAHDCIYKVKSGEQYDLIFMDYLMPDMDGIELMHVLKKLEAFNVPPIVCLTANALVGTKEAYLKEGFDDFISKPVDLIELDKVIHKFLGKKKD